MTTHLQLQTDAGAITLTLHDGAAPLSCRFVVDMVEAGHFASASFYRSTTLDNPNRAPLLQGGPLAPLLTGGSDPVPANLPLLETIETTGSTGLRHERGTVSLARDLFNTGHALPELFVCLDDYPDLDEGGRTEPDALGFPAFATVTAGLDVVSAVANAPTDGTTPIEQLAGQILTVPVAITGTDLIRIDATG